MHAPRHPANTSFKDGHLYCALQIRLDQSKALTDYIPDCTGAASREAVGLTARNHLHITCHLPLDLLLLTSYPAEYGSSSLQI